MTSTALHAERERATTRVLLVEDHASVRQGLARVLEAEPDLDVVGQAASVAEARAMLDGVDVAIVDLGLPDGDGGEIIRDLRRANPSARALVLSALVDLDRLARAVEDGAAGALDKTVGVDELVAAVRRLRAGDMLIPYQEMVDLLRFAAGRRNDALQERQEVESLTKREVEVLEAMALGLASKEIAARLCISVRTERNHVANILAKLNAHSQLAALVLAVRCGVVEIPTSSW